MKFSIIYLVLFCLFVSCNNIPGSGKNQSNEPAYTPKKEDLKYINIGYDLGLGHPKGLKVGDKAPDFKLTAPDGAIFKLSESLEEGPLVLMFYRGQWCPVCNRHLTAFMKDLPKLNAKGISVLAVGPETNENIKKAIEKSDLKTIDKSDVKFAVVQDPAPDYMVMKAYDVLFHVTAPYQEKIRTKLNTDIAENNGDKNALLPVPATYLIGQDGIIKYRQFDLNYKERASVDDILNNI